MITLSNDPVNISFDIQNTIFESRFYVHDRNGNHRDEF